MKSILILMLTLFFINVSGQDLSVSTGLEQTVAGTELQISGGYVTKKNWSLGAFHQSKITNASSETDNSKQGASWYGLYINAPIANTKKINVFLQMRTGFYENQFIVVVPSLETNINLNKMISLGFGTSLRYSYPAFSFKSNIQLFNIHKK